MGFHCINKNEGLLSICLIWYVFGLMDSCLLLRNLLNNYTQVVLPNISEVELENILNRNKFDSLFLLALVRDCANTVPKLLSSVGWLKTMWINSGHPGSYDLWFLPLAERRQKHFQNNITITLFVLDTRLCSVFWGPPGIFYIKNCNNAELTYTCIYWKTCCARSWNLGLSSGNKGITAL